VTFFNTPPALLPSFLLPSDPQPHFFNMHILNDPFHSGVHSITQVHEILLTYYFTILFPTLLEIFIVISVSLSVSFPISPSLPSISTHIFSTCIFGMTPYLNKIIKWDSLGIDAGSCSCQTIPKNR
jgi:hypothetical protein